MASNPFVPPIGLTRRDLLKVGALTPLASVACQTPVRTADSSFMDLPGAEELIPENMPQGFSQQEMAGRWLRVREGMRTSGFDCLIVPMRPEGNADVKYLTESAANWVVFPLEGQVTSIFRRRREAEEAKAGVNLDIDLRISLLNRSQVIIDCLKDSGLEKGRIGVGNLEGTLRNDEGGVSHTTLKRIRTALPGAAFSSAADLLMRVKLVRSREEIEVLKLVSRVSELGLRAITENALPGGSHGAVWFKVCEALFEASGEAAPRVSFRAGDEAGTGGGKPLAETLEAGRILNQVISASVLGYLSQVNHSMCLGPQAPADWESSFRFCVDLFHTLVDWIKPGRSFTDFGNFYRRKVEERGEYAGGVVFHSAGPMGDGPRMGPNRADENLDLVLMPGMVFTIKPRIPIKGVAAPAAQVGDPVLVTETGAERLGRRQLDVITLGS